ncbi:MAG: hypothetical protein C0501_09755 [Isosphaera sp.]|nr:hypothetical protein [Isosphaera sp.]
MVARAGPGAARVPRSRRPWPRGTRMAFSLVRSLVRHSLRYFGDTFVGWGVVPVGSIAAAVYDDWCAEADAAGGARSDATPLRRQIERTAQNPEAFAAQVEAELDNAGVPLTDAHRQAVLAYLKQFPGRVRASLRRPDDPSGRTVPADLPLRRAEDLLPFLPERMPRFRPGARPVPGTDLVLDGLLGVGGFGEVWRARHQGRPHLAPVALKFCTTEASAKSLRKEVELLDRVMTQGRHAGIVELRYAHLEGATPCLEYEFVDGGDLGGLIEELHAAGKMTPEASARLLLQLAQAVGFAHRLRPAITHRDLKPANILTTRADGKVRLKVTDFGIGGIAAAHALEVWAGGGRDTAGGGGSTLSVGSCTPLYASPQQRAFGPPDPRDDVYALGVIWYQMLTGDTTREAPRGGAWKKRLGESGAAREMIALLERCVEDDPAERPADARVFAEELKALAAPPQPAQPPPPPPAPPPEEWYYVRDGKRQGPVTFSELKRLAARGELDRPDQVWTEGYKAWVTAGSVSGLCPPPGSVPPPIMDATTRVTGSVRVGRKFVGGVAWYRVSLDGSVLGESRLIKGGDFEFETTAGEHVIDVDYTGALFMTKNRRFTVTFPKPGHYSVQLYMKQGALTAWFELDKVVRTGDAKA